MKKQRTRSALSAVAAALLMTGCGGPDVIVVDLATDEVSPLPYNGNRRQIVLSVNEAASEFSTLSIADYSLPVATYDYAGKRKRITEFPSLVNSFGRIALSDNAARLAYWKKGTRDLYVYDVANKTDSVVYTNVAARFGLEICAVYWVSDETLVLVLEGDDKLNRSHSSVEAVNVKDGSRRVLFTTRDRLAYQEFALSPDKQKLAFSHGEITVLDLRSGAVLARSLRGGGGVCWSPTGDAVAFASEGKIWRIDLGSNESSVLYWPSVPFYEFRIAWGDGVVLYNGEAAPGSKTGVPTPLISADLKTRMARRICYAQFNGKWTIMDGGKKLVCEVGY